MPPEMIRIEATGEDVPAELEWRGRTLKLSHKDGQLDYRIDGEAYFHDLWLSVFSDCPKLSCKKGAERGPRRWQAQVGGGKATGEKSSLEALETALEGHLKCIEHAKLYLEGIRVFARALGVEDG